MGFYWQIWPHPGMELSSGTRMLGTKTGCEGGLAAASVPPLPARVDSAVLTG